MPTTYRTPNIQWARSRFRKTRPLSKDRSASSDGVDSVRRVSSNSALPEAGAPLFGSKLVTIDVLEGASRPEFARSQGRREVSRLLGRRPGWKGTRNALMGLGTRVRGPALRATLDALRPALSRRVRQGPAVHVGGGRGVQAAGPSRSRATLPQLPSTRFSSRSRDGSNDANS